MLWFLPRLRIIVGGLRLPGSFLSMTSLSVDSRKLDRLHLGA